jgi:hypothetical protein
MVDIVALGEPLIEFNQARSADPHTYFRGSAATRRTWRSPLRVRRARRVRDAARHRQFRRMFIDLWSREGIDGRA